jgi:hypothetical protein
VVDHLIAVDEVLILANNREKWWLDGEENKNVNKN